MAKAVKVKAVNLATGESAVYASMGIAAKKGGWCLTAIRSCVRGTMPSHGGYSFQAMEGLAPLLSSNPVIIAAKLRNKGMTNQQIADKMSITLNTARYYCSQGVNLGICKTYHETRIDAEFKGKGI